MPKTPIMKSATAYANMLRRCQCVVSHRGPVSIVRLTHGPVLFDRDGVTEMWSLPVNRDVASLVLTGADELAWWMGRAMINPYALAQQLWAYYARRRPSDWTALNSIIMTHKLHGMLYMQELKRLGIRDVEAKDMRLAMRACSTADYATISPREALTAIGERRRVHVHYPRPSLDAHYVARAHIASGGARV
jgi:hypothetical protein